MIRYKTALLAFTLWWLPGLYAQNLYDADHTRTFADHLFRTGKYEEAALEYERLVFLDPGDANAKIQLLQAYRYAQRPQQGIRAFHRLYPTIESAPSAARRELFRMYVMSDNYRKAAQLLQHLSGPRKGRESALLVLQGHIDSAQKQAEACDDPICREMQHRFLLWQKASRRSPFLAGMLSTLLPGAGKLYVGRPLDGFFSFLFVAGNAWQSWLGFKRNGLQSVRGWIFGGFAAGFYLGNIWGSVRAARRHNQQIDEKLHRQARRLLVAPPR